MTIASMAARLNRSAFVSFAERRTSSSAAAITGNVFGSRCKRIDGNDGSAKQVAIVRWTIQRSRFPAAAQFGTQRGVVTLLDQFRWTGSVRSIVSDLQSADAKTRAESELRSAFDPNREGSPTRIALADQTTRWSSAKALRLAIPRPSTDHQSTSDGSVKYSPCNRFAAATSRPH